MSNDSKRLEDLSITVFSTGDERTVIEKISNALSKDDFFKMYGVKIYELFFSENPHIFLDNTGRLRIKAYEKTNDRGYVTLTIDLIEGSTIKDSEFLALRSMIQESIIRLKSIVKHNKERNENTFVLTF